MELFNVKNYLLFGMVLAFWKKCLIARLQERLPFFVRKWKPNTEICLKMYISGIWNRYGVQKFIPEADVTLCYFWQFSVVFDKLCRLY